MSDFGAMISVSKKDKTAFSDEEETFVRKCVTEVHESSQLTDALGRPYSFIVGISQYLGDPDFYTMNVLLSDYWGNSEDFELMKVTGLRDMKVIAAQLGDLLGEKFLLEETFEWW